MVCRSELSEVLLAESPSHTPVSRVSITSALSMRTFRVNGASSEGYNIRAQNDRWLTFFVKSSG